MARWGPWFAHLSVFKWWLPTLLIPVLLLGNAWSWRMPIRIRRAYTTLLVLAVTAFAALLLARAASNVISPPEWDVKAFWMFGKVAATGRNFYSPTAFHEVANALGIKPEDPEFADYILDSGFHYPPPTVLLVAPFGELPLRPAAAAWYALQFVALASALILLARCFFPGGSWRDLAFTAALLLTLRGTFTTVAFGQTNFLLLLLLLLFWRSEKRPHAGVYMALGIVAKPLFAFLLPYLVFRRRWPALLATGLTLGALCLLTAALFGLEPFRSYLASNPVSRLPNSIYVYDENQSLLATIVRLTNFDFATGSPLWHPYHLGSAAVIAVMTAAAMWRAGDRDIPLALSVLLAAALLLYPQTWEHYTALLIVPVLLLWTKRDELGISTLASVAILTAVFALNRYDHGNLAFVGTLLIWGVLVTVCLAGSPQSFRRLSCIPLRTRSRRTWNGASPSAPTVTTSA